MIKRSKRVKKGYTKFTGGQFTGGVKRHICGGLRNTKRCSCTHKRHTPYCNQRNYVALVNPDSLRHHTWHYTYLRRVLKREKR